MALRRVDVAVVAAIVVFSLRNPIDGAGSDAKFTTNVSMLVGTH